MPPSPPPPDYFRAVALSRNGSIRTASRGQPNSRAKSRFASSRSSTYEKYPLLAIHVLPFQCPMATACPSGRPSGYTPMTFASAPIAAQSSTTAAARSSQSPYPRSHVSRPEDHRSRSSLRYSTLRRTRRATCFGESASAMADSQSTGVPTDGTAEMNTHVRIARVAASLLHFFMSSSVFGLVRSSFEMQAECHMESPCRNVLIHPRLRRAFGSARQLPGVRTNTGNRAMRSHTNRTGGR